MQAGSFFELIPSDQEYKEHVDHQTEFPRSCGNSSSSRTAVCCAKTFRSACRRTLRPQMQKIPRRKHKGFIEIAEVCWSSMLNQCRFSHFGAQMCKNIRLDHLFQDEPCPPMNVRREAFSKHSQRRVPSLKIATDIFWGEECGFWAKGLLCQLQGVESKVCVTKRRVASRIKIVAALHRVYL